MFITMSPLEQFQILPLIPLRFIGNYDFSFTNGSLIILIALGSFFFLIQMVVSSNGSFFIAPTR